MTARDQKLLMVGNGFFAGLASLGVPAFSDAMMNFESNFGKAWHDWPPHGDRPGQFPDISSTGRRPRDILFRMSKSISPYREFRISLTGAPNNLTTQDFLDIYADAAQPADWVALAKAYVDEAGRWGAPR